MRKAWLFLGLLLAPSVVLAQGGSISSGGILVLSPLGRPIGGATVTVCAFGATGIPCSPTITVYTDPTLITPASNPATSDGNGNVFVYAAPGRYSYTVTGTGITGKSFTATVAGSGGGDVGTGLNNVLTGNNTVASPGSLTVSGTTTASGALLAESGRPWIDVTGAPYNADPTGVADSTTAIQNAHNACAAFALGPCQVFFPYGTYKVTSVLTWSPYVPAISGGRVILTTALASGNFISISDQYGKPTPDPNSNGSVRSKPFVGTFVILNTAASNTAFAFFIGGATAANYATDMTLDGLSVVGFGGGQAAGSTAGVFKFGYNAFTTHITNFHGLNNGGSYFSILAGATNTGEGLTIDSSSFGSSNQVTYPAYLFSWNTSSAGDFHFHNCSYDYLKGISDPAQTAINTSVNMTNSHFEWNQTTNPYIQAANGISFKIINAKFFTPLSAGFFNPFVGTVAGASTLSIVNARYESGGIIAKLFDNGSGTAGNLLAIDPFVNSSFAPTTYFSRSGGAGAVVTFNAVPADTPTSYDFSGNGISAVGLPGNVFLGGNSTATNVPQFISNSSTVAGVAGTNYTLFRAGVAAEESHSSTGDIGLAGKIAASSGFTCAAAGACDAGTAALPIGNLWLGTAPTNNFKFQPAATAAARTLNLTDPLVATTAIPLFGGIGAGHMQTKRAAGCATGTAQFNTCTTTITWTTAFPDANYTAVCTGDIITTSVPTIQGITAKVGASVTVQTIKLDAAATAAQFTNIDCKAQHD